MWANIPMQDSYVYQNVFASTNSDSNILAIGLSFGGGLLHICGVSRRLKYVAMYPIRLRSKITTTC